MLGCFRANHGCIDNIEHTMAGIEMRLACNELMQAQGHEEPTGRAKITSGYNLPAKYVLHTVGPIVTGRLTQEHKRLLASCYKSCLELASKNSCSSVAFCCISTGVFMFPKDKAADIAVATVLEYLNTHRDSPVQKVIFNVFTDEDYRIYDSILGA
jgi:O-acetyl-ADP-ribose deacetylase (regulator of RNase III)